MRVLLVLVSVLVLAATAGVARAAPSGTISGPNEPGPYAFGATVTFTTTSAGLKGGQYPLVYVECHSVVDGSLLYGQLDYPDTAFLLGGGSSQWWIQRDDAHCTASLYAYGGKERGHDTIVLLGSPVLFDAAGA